MEYVMLRALNKQKTCHRERLFVPSSINPKEDDDDMSTEESDVDPCCMEPNDPTIRIQT